MAMASLAMLWMAVRRPLASIRQWQATPTADSPEPPEPPDEEASNGALLTAFGLGAVALAAVGVMLAVALTGYRDPEVRVNAQRDAMPSANHAPATRGASSVAEQRTLKEPKRSHPSVPRRLFGRTSVWNRRMQATMPIDAASPSLIAFLEAEVDRELQTGTGPWIARAQGSTPVYRVGAQQRPVRVQLDAEGATALARAFAAVPIPDGAQPGHGPEHHMTIWQPSTDRLWELSGARRESDGWHARWGGAIREVSRSRGYYDPTAWPGATAAWGATGSGLPLIGGTILVDDLRRRRINHALALSLPAPRAGAFAWPAQRTDGTGPLSALAEGAQLRLDPQLDLRSLEVPPLVRMIAQAAQDYGLVVRGRTEWGISFFAEDPAPLASNPYPRYFVGRASSELLAHFPWERLQVLAMRLCWTAPCGQD
jgi:hypothetical protein